MGGTTNPNGHQDLNAKMFINWKPLTSWKYYELVHSADQKHEDDENACVTSTESLMATRPVRRNPLFFSLWSILLAGLLLSIVAGTLGFLAGRHLPELFPSDFLPGPAGTVRRVWTYNRTFSSPPSEKTEEAWKSIFPRGRGFFSHPSLDVNISGIAVFHELHCLSGIWFAYYDALNQTHAGYSHQSQRTDDEDAKIDAANDHNDPHHVRHCFDYLRQALICAADTNLELIDWPLGGSTGWGFERKCRDYDRVVAWAEKWRYHSQTTIA